MRIETVGDASISPQARTYAEYRLFAALSQVVDTGEVRSASLALHRSQPRRHCERVVCTVRVEFRGGEVIRFTVSGDHPYAAINRAVERVGRNAWPVRQDPTRGEMAAAE